MSNKLSILKKKLITRLIKSAIMLAGCAIAFGAAYYFYQDAEDEAKVLQSRDGQLKRKIIELESKNDSSGSILQKYKTLQSESKIKPLDLNRKRISNLLNELSEAYRINNLDIQIGDVKERKNGVFNNNTGTIITTEILLRYDSPSDIHSFAFIDELLKEFPGYINLKSFTTRRAQQVDESTLRALVKGGRANFMNSSVKFEWLGLRPNLATDQQQGAQ